MGLIAYTAWVITVEDAHGERRWFGVQAPGRRGIQITCWDWVQCRRTLQCATRELAEARLAEIKESLPTIAWSTSLQVEEVDREFLAAVIGLVHAPGWHDED